MSNQNSALVRSNLGRNSALATLSNLSPSLINALAKLTTKAVDRYVNSGNGNAIPVNISQSPTPRRTQRRRRRGRAATQAVPRMMGTAFPDVRRKVQIVHTLTSDAAGDIKFVGNLARSAVSVGGVGLLSDAFLGAVANMFKMYSAFKVHSASASFTCSLPDTASFSLALGWTSNMPSVPTSFSQFPTFPSYVIGGKQDTIKLTGRPRNLHGGVVPVSVSGSDDNTELTAGSFVFYGLSNVATAIVGIVCFDVEVTLMGA